MMSWMAFGETSVCADAGAAASAAMARCAEASQAIRRGSGMMTIRFNRATDRRRRDFGRDHASERGAAEEPRQDRGGIGTPALAARADKVIEQGGPARAGTLWLLVEYNAPGRRNHRPHRVGGVVETDEVI
jgi:hypothetical protein